MITTDQAYAAFRDANPAPVVEVDTLPSPLEALRMAQDAPTPTVPLAPPEPPRRSLRVGLLTAAAVFALIVAIGVVAYFAGRGGGADDVVDDPQVTTTLPQATTTVPPTTAPPAETLAITPATQSLLDQFAAAYGRDFESFATLLDPDLAIEIRFQDPPTIWGLDEMREQFEFYEALNTTLELGDCRAVDAEAVSCTMLRADDLVRIQGLEVVTDGLITLRFTDGLATSWAERYRVDIPYQDLVVTPFSLWLTDTYPEVPHPKVSGGAPWWTRRGDVVEQLPALVAEYAASLGAALDR